jgi:hypothetical protein
MKHIIFKVFFFLGLILFSNSVFSQKFIEGIIKSTDGFPVASATVAIKNAKSFAVADVIGYFKIASPEKFPVVLIISSVGYISKS